MSRRLMCGVGLNDLKGATTDSNGKMTPFYQTWKHMIHRCYSENYHNKHPSYIGCSVCKEWLTFSNFKTWMMNQDWEGKQLDKDLLFVGNKVYCPETCVFIPHNLNTFINEGSSITSDGLIGTSFDISRGKYKARCSNPFKECNENLGYFDTQEEAHVLWKKRKHELSCKLANLQVDKRIADALRNRYI